ncbi:MAG TPA: TetR/AcrR family transcriptional regulator C-terminal ligand-binding domain-containing protein [Polyangiales bacterium]|nr:TetR/AcrR family transcriptional regulator C-terminal ligand-binding domain-containing protein [Polyangiales bacterium]
MKAKKPLPRPGGRTARVRAEVQEALRWLLARKPQAEISIADIAERSGVHAATIYRRWGTLEGLMLDMTVERISRDSPMPDTGTLEGDLYAWGQRIASSVVGPDGPVLLRTVMQAKPSDRSVLLRRAGEIQTLLDRAVARGEPALRYEDVIDGLLAPIFIRQLFSLGGLDDGFVRTLVRRTISFGTPPSG